MTTITENAILGTYSIDALTDATSRTLWKALVYDAGAIEQAIQMVRDNQAEAKRCYVSEGLRHAAARACPWLDGGVEAWELKNMALRNTIPLARLTLATGITIG